MKNIELKPKKDGGEKALAVNTPSGKVVIGTVEPYNQPVQTMLYFVNESGTSDSFSIPELIASRDVRKVLQKLVNLRHHPSFPKIKDLPAWDAAIQEARNVL